MDYVEHLEQRLAERSNELEEIHLEAAIDAELTTVAAPTPTNDNDDKKQNVQASSNQNSNATTNHEPIFADYSNPHSVAHCLSPYVPSSADRVAAFLQFSGLYASPPSSTTENRAGVEVLLDLGCGDGRVCIAATKLTGCCSIGVDVSPPCIEMAQIIAQQELESSEQHDQCRFYACDATLDPDQLLLHGQSTCTSQQDTNNSSNSSSTAENNHDNNNNNNNQTAAALSRDLSAATIVYLFTYPTLLRQLVPLLQRLMRDHAVKRIVTQTYHLEPSEAHRIQTSDEFNLVLYDQMW